MTETGGPDAWGSESDADRTGMSEQLLAALAARPHDMVGLVEALSPRVADRESLVRLMGQVAVQAVGLLQGVRWAGVTAQFDGPAFTCARTHDRVVGLDDQQYRGGDGPCLRALRTGRPVQMGLEQVRAQWPPLGRAAAAAGVRAFISLPLLAGAVPAAALNLYCDRHLHPGGLDADVVTVLVQYVQRGLQDYATAHPEDVGAIPLRQALYSRNVIGRAQGVIMARHAVSAAEALDVLGQQARAARLPLWRYADGLVRAAGG